MNTFPVLSREALDDAQRCLWDELTLGTRGFYTGGAQATRLPDLYNAWLQFPQFGHLMLRLADELRARSHGLAPYERGDLAHRSPLRKLMGKMRVADLARLDPIGAQRRLKN